MSLVLLFGCSDPEQSGDRPGQRDDSGPRAPEDGGVDDGGAPSSVASCAEIDCDPNATCDDADGSAACTCAAGYSGNGMTCADVDECEVDNGGCDEHATCVNRPGFRRCLCDDGFSGDGETCTGTNECDDAALNTCDPNASCDDAEEGFTCACGSGTSGDGFGCGDVDECADTDLFECGANADCENTFGGYDCECDPLFGGDGVAGCVPLCEANPCAGNELCRVRWAGTDCNSSVCKPGFVGDGVTCTAVVSGECTACDGQGGDDIAEGVCTGVPGAGTCSCAPGYAGTFPTCVDMDECATNDCGSNATCIEVPGGFFCDCADGYAWDILNKCVDEDECAAAPCHPNADCEDDADTPGAFTCTCKSGFSGDGSVCSDIDECEAGDDDCLADGTARCVNTAGDFDCRCRRGYAGDGVTECENLNECTNPNLNDCAEAATCTDETPEQNPVGYECTCPRGLGGDGTQCTDVNECLNAALNDCAENASCVNSPGGYTCECLPPFAGDDPDACHCDLSGYWAMRQDVDACWCDRDLLGITIISGGAMEATVWELHRYAYDGDTIEVEKMGCGADDAPDLISPHFGETYSSYVPDETFFGLELEAGKDIAESDIVPGSTYTTPDEAAVAGIDLGDDPECEDCWPASSTTINAEGGAAPAWIDTEGDGEPGITLWPRPATEVPDEGSGFYSYIPVDLNPSMPTEVTQRAGCVSVATRVITHLEANVASCTRIVGEVVNVKSEGRVGSCTFVPVDFTEDISCSAADWDAMTQCDAAAVERLDDQDQDQTSAATFELVKIGDLDDEVDCADVRDELPAFGRSTPTPIDCDCP